MAIKQRRGKAARSLEIRFNNPIPAILLSPVEEPAVKLTGKGLLVNPAAPLTKQSINEWTKRRSDMIEARMIAACKLFNLSIEDLLTDGVYSASVIFTHLFPGYALRRLGSSPPARPLRWTADHPASIRCYLASLYVRKSGVSKLKAWHRAVKDSELGVISDGSIAQAWKTFRKNPMIRSVDRIADDGAFDYAIDMVRTLLIGAEERVRYGKK
jgi:hypothetical protein